MASTATYPLNSVVCFSVTFRAVAGRYAKDPTTVSFFITNPLGVTTEIPFNAGTPVPDPDVLDQVIHDFVGNFHTNIRHTLAGDYTGRYQADGSVIAGQSLTITIAP